jgi:hypothetical protein
LPEGLKETTKTSARIAGVPAEIRTEHVPNTGMELYHYTSLFDKSNIIIITNRNEIYENLLLIGCDVMASDT